MTEQEEHQNKPVGIPTGQTYPSNSSPDYINYFITLRTEITQIT